MLKTNLTTFLQKFLIASSIPVKRNHLKMDLFVALQITQSLHSQEGGHLVPEIYYTTHNIKITPFHSICSTQYKYYKTIHILLRLYKNLPLLTLLNDPSFF